MGEVDRRPILLLVNPAAGQKRAATRTDRPRSPAELLGGLTTWGLSVELRELGEGEDTTALARAAAKAGRDVVVAGGDGTVGSAASALVGSDATLGIIPLGTFNNIARGAGIPTDLAQALEVIVRGERRAIDVGLAWHVSAPRSQNGAAIGDPPAGAATFFEAVGVGLDAEGFGVAEVGERLGWLPAARAAWRVLRRRKTPLWLVIDGKRYRTASPAVTVCNGPFHGFGFALVPDANPADGPPGGASALRARRARQAGPRAARPHAPRSSAGGGRPPAHAAGARGRSVDRDHASRDERPCRRAADLCLIGLTHRGQADAHPPAAHGPPAHSDRSCPQRSRPPGRPARRRVRDRCRGSRPGARGGARPGDG